MAAGMGDAEVDAIPPQEDGEGEALQNVDLQSHQKEPVYQPTLQFSDTIAREMSGSVEGNVVVTESPIKGTELHSRQRTNSRGSQLMEWSTHHMKITKQLVSEKIGRSTRTIDPNLDQRIESLKETQKKYAQLLELSSRFHLHFGNVVEMQKSLAENFAFMSVRTPELHTEFHFNSETQKVIARNGETLLAAVQFFVSNIQTVGTKTIDDTLQTVKGYETARLSYDAYRNELEDLKKQTNTSERAAGRVPQATNEFEKHKAKFEQLRQDVDIKLKLLDENKVWGGPLG